MIQKSHIHLALFFTSGISLKTWDEIGMFEREVELYRRLQNTGVEITLVTYGDVTDLTYANRLPGMRILCNRWNLSPHFYRRWLPILHAPYLIQATHFKTQQVKGADRAVLAARLLRKKLIVRSGYLLSNNNNRKFGSNAPETRYARKIEAYAFGKADHIEVTTLAIKQTVIEHYHIPTEKISVIPNFVDVDLFKPSNREKHNNAQVICYIGRLDEIKNISALLDAVKDLDIELYMIGDGPLRDQLFEKAEKEKIKAKFFGNLPNAELPQYLTGSNLFILPSLIEGHPKALIEAMACGLPVIGSNVPGIRELIEHRQNGYLCGTSASDMRVAIQEVLSNPKLMHYMGRNAREYVMNNFSLEHILNKEFVVLKGI